MTIWQIFSRLIALAFIALRSTYCAQSRNAPLVTQKLHSKAAIGGNDGRGPSPRCTIQQLRTKISADNTLRSRPLILVPLECEVSGATVPYFGGADGTRRLAELARIFHSSPVFSSTKR
jgi:hypothetical protein